MSILSEARSLLALLRRHAANIENLRNLAVEDYISRQLQENARYQNPRRLNRYEYQVYSQNGEDGIIAEIFNRIGIEKRFFVEFGVGDGLENNTAYLLLKGYAGCWIESNSEQVKRIDQKFSLLIKNKRLKVMNARVSQENIESLFKEASIPQEFDLLSIDIDGNDYWVWKAIDAYHPRVVVIEYNAMYPPDIACVAKYNPEFQWDQTSYYGASLKSLETLGTDKGYRLVGCDFRGVNAFFVRQDLVKDRFLEPFTAETHYEPIRYFLAMKKGYPRNFGDFDLA